MPPRGRNKKRGNLRIDAALDAMSSFGFSSKLVRSTVKELLDVYGGDDGWVFIEEGSYTLLIDTILEKLKDGGAMEKLENGRTEDHAETSVAGCSSGFNEDSSSNLGAEVTVKQSDDILKSAFEGNEAFDTTLSTNDFAAEGRCCMDDKDSGGDDRLRSTLNQSSPANAPKTSRRKCYHGWISRDDNEDLVHLTPAPLPEEIAKLLKLHGSRKHKKRWDVKPGDL